MDETNSTQTISSKLDCKDCGAILKYAPGTEILLCEYCGSSNQIVQAETSEQPEEISYLHFLNTTGNGTEMMEILTVKCKNCGADSTLQPNVTADNCVFCVSPLVVEGATSRTIIKPAYLLPFHVETKVAFVKLKEWGSRLWFVPGDLKRDIHRADKLSGIYVPYWTYDTDTMSKYWGERGRDYTVKNSEGKNITKTDWTSVSGRIRKSFDDLLVMASYSLPEKQAKSLEPWDLENLLPYKDEYLSGFRCESYQVTLEQGFEKVKEETIDPIIRGLARSDIGGDHQRIHSINTSYDNITFKHILLPVWLSTYRYKNKVYRCVINARTGEVQGEHPLSWIKVFFAILTLGGIGYVIYYYLR